MLNSSSRSSSVINQSIKFNAVSGTMFKSCEGSFFKRFHLKSEYADDLLSPNPECKIGNEVRTWEKTSVVVLQTMVVGDMEVLAEIIEKEKYEQLMQKGAE